MKYFFWFLIIVVAFFAGTVTTFWLYSPYEYQKQIAYQKNLQEHCVKEWKETEIKCQQKLKEMINNCKGK